MSTPILATKLYLPQPQPRVVLRPRLIERLNEGMHRRHMYRPTDGRPLTEDLPYAPNTRKGMVRARMFQELLVAHTSGKVRVAIGRTSDFFGPRVIDSAAGEQVFEEPFVADHSKFERAFGEHATALKEAIGGTVRWYRDKRPAGDVRPAA